MGCVYKLKNSPFWWIKYVGADGRSQYESSKSTDHTTAKETLKLREGKIAEGVPVTAAVGRLKFKDIADDLVTHYENTSKKTLAELKLRLKLHLLPFFGRHRAADINAALVNRYIAARKAEPRIVRTARTITHRDGRREEIPAIVRPPSNAAINRELEHLQRAFTLAKKSGQLLHVPYIPMLDEDNVRRGFLEPHQLADVLAHLPAHYDPPVRFAYLTGWRMASEVVTLEWRNVDFNAGEIRLDDSKNGEGRVYPMTNDLRTLLQTQKQEREKLTKAGHLVPWVFWRMVAEGRRGPLKPHPIKSFYKAWRSACRLAGVPGRIPHDMRRSSARNMVTKRGVPQKVALELGGWKTAAILSRYQIVSPGDLRDGAARLDGLLPAPEVKPVVKLAAVGGSRARRSR